MRFGLKKTLRFALVFTMLSSSIGISQSNFWFRGGTNGNLGTASNWAIDAAGATNGTSPGVLDTAIFSISSSNTVPLNRWSMGSANRSYGSVIISNSGTNYIMRTGDAGATNSSANNLTLMFGITNASGAGTFQLGDTDRKATLKLGATNTDFVVANNSANTMTFQQQVGISSSGSNNRTLVIAGTGLGSIIFDSGLENGGTNAAALALRVNNTGAVQLGSSTYTGGTILNSGTIALASGSALGTGSLTINGGAIGSVTSARTITNNIIVGGNFGLGVTNAGFSGQTTTFNGNMDLGNATRTVSLLANTTIFGGDISNGGLTIESADATRQLRVTNAVTYAGPTTVRGGVLVLSNTGALSLNNAVNLSGATTNATFDISGLSGSGTVLGSLSGSANSTVALGGKALTVGGDNSDRTFSGVISGAGGSLIKNGSGVMSLSASNSYTGSTAVNGGTLIVNGSLASSNTIVSAGATLGGSGFLQAVTLNGGTIAPGNSPGVLTMQNLDASNGNFVFELGAPAGRGTTYDAIDVAQNLVFGANTAFQFSVFGGYSFAENNTYDLFDWGTSFDPGSFNTDVLKTALNTGINLSSSGLTWNVDNFLRDGTVSVALIPEPSTAALLGVGLVAFAGLRAFRRRKV